MNKTNGFSTNTDGKKADFFSETPVTNRGVDSALSESPKKYQESVETGVVLAWDWIQYSAKKEQKFIIPKNEDPTQFKQIKPRTGEESSEPGSDNLEEAFALPVTDPELNAPIEVSNGAFKFKIMHTAYDIIKHVYLWIDNDWQKFAVLCTELRGNIASEWCQVKIDNKFCYQQTGDIIQQIKAMNDAFGITFMHYNRMDVAADFQKLTYRNLTPQQFIDKASRGHYRFARKSVTVHYTEDELKKEIAKMKDIMRRRGFETKGVEFKLREKNRDGFAVDEFSARTRTGKAQSIRIGSRKSGISIVMYNKSAEMRAKVDKAYIREQWKHAGFIEGIETYRLEFQYMKDAKDTLIYEDEEKQSVALTISHSDINALNYLKELFSALYDRHFVVAIYNEKHERNFARMRRVDILNSAYYKLYYEVVRLSEKQKSTTYTKNAVRQLIEMAVSYDQRGMKITASELLRSAQDEIETHDLHKWRKKYFPDLEFEERLLTYDDLLTMKEINSQKLVQVPLSLIEANEESREKKERERAAVLEATRIFTDNDIPAYKIRGKMTVAQAMAITSVFKRK